MPWSSPSSWTWAAPRIRRRRSRCTPPPPPTGRGSPTGAAPRALLLHREAHHAAVPATGEEGVAVAPEQVAVDDRRAAPDLVGRLERPELLTGPRVERGHRPRRGAHEGEAGDGADGPEDHPLVVLRGPLEPSRRRLEGEHPRHVRRGVRGGVTDVRHRHDALVHEGGRADLAPEEAARREPG